MPRKRPRSPEPPSQSHLHPRDRVPPEAWGHPSFVWIIARHPRESNMPEIYHPKVFKAKKDALQEMTTNLKHIDEFCMLKKNLILLVFSPFFASCLSETLANHNGQYQKYLPPGHVKLYTNSRIAIPAITQ